MSGSTHDPWVEEQLDKWVSAKRQKKYVEADSIRDMLRGMGVDPDVARPRGHDAGAGSMPGGGRANMGNADNVMNTIQNSMMQMMQTMTQMMGTLQQTAMMNQNNSGMQMNPMGMMNQNNSGMQMNPMGMMNQNNSGMQMNPMGMMSQNSGMQMNPMAMMNQNNSGMQMNPMGMMNQNNMMNQNSCGSGNMGNASNMGNNMMQMMTQMSQMMTQMSAPADSNPAKRQKVSGMSDFGGSQSSTVLGATGDRWTDEQLDKWILAKRSKDFETADRIRDELRTYGVDPDTVRPRGWKGEGGKTGDAWTDDQLDKWLIAKKQKDFLTADSIRDVLRGFGVDPDTVRPRGWEIVAGATDTKDPWVEEQLDKWLAMKRQKKYAEADEIRDNLRTMGVDPDTVRPRNTWNTYGTMGGGTGSGNSAMGNSDGATGNSDQAMNAMQNSMTQMMQTMTQMMGTMAQRM